MVADRLVGAIILINSIVLMSYGFEGLRSAYDNPLFVLDYLCTIYFLFEAAIKITLYGWREYWRLTWNRIDFAIVLLSSPMILAPVLDTHDFGIILILRIGRVFRLFRIAKFIHDADKLWAGLRRALVASVGVLLALTTYNFVLGVMASYLFYDVDPEHFGDPFVSMYSLFKVFTIEGWYEIPDQIALKATEAGLPHLGLVARGFFIFAVLTGGIIGLSIANAIFVDKMVMDNTDLLEQKIDELRGEIAELKGLLKPTN